MPKKSAVDYAEDDLGVHEVHEDALSVHDSLNKALGLYASHATTIRALNERIDAREYELASEIRAGKPDISQTALDRAIKDARHTDDMLRSLRADLRETQDAQERAHADIEGAKYRLRVLSARMNELGGLLAFLGAAKAAAARRNA